MTHFVAYHNTEKMGHPLHEGEPLGLLTNKPVRHLIHNVVWFVTGEGTGTRRYLLGACSASPRSATPAKGVSNTLHPVRGTCFGLLFQSRRWIGFLRF